MIYLNQCHIKTSLFSRTAAFLLPGIPVEKQAGNHKKRYGNQWAPSRHTAPVFTIAFAQQRLQRIEINESIRDQYCGNELNHYVDIFQEKRVPKPYHTGTKQKVVQKIDQNPHYDGKNIKYEIGKPDIRMKTEKQHGRRYRGHNSINCQKEIFRKRVDEHIFFQPYG